MFDNTETDSLELLRFYPSLTAIDGFEDALHERVRQVGRIPDHAFPLIVAVERLEGDGALALVSTHTPGKRLSAFFDRPGPRRGLNPAFVTGIVTQVDPGADGAAVEGRRHHSQRDHARPHRRDHRRPHLRRRARAGPGPAQLNLSASQLWREFGLVSAPTPSGAIQTGPAQAGSIHAGSARLDAQNGRVPARSADAGNAARPSLSPLDLKDRVPDLLDQWSDAATRAGLASDRLRVWLERALQLGSRSYATAADAYADLRDMPSESPASAFDSLPMSDVDLTGRSYRSLQPAKRAAGQDSLMANATAPDDFPLINTPQPARALTPLRPSLSTLLKASLSPVLRANPSTLLRPSPRSCLPKKPGTCLCRK